MSVTELDKKDFNDFIEDGNTMIDFWAPWCNPCKILSPLIEEIAKEQKGKIKFGKVNVDDNQELAQRFQIMSIPTVIFFQNGRQVDRFSGAIPKSDILKKIKENF